MVKRGMHGEGGIPPARMARGVRGRRACMVGETATEAGGTHPTGMHSCF